MARTPRHVRLLLELLAIDGLSGGETEVARFIEAALREAGAPAKAITRCRPPRNSPVAGQVGNLVLRLPGTLRGPRRLLSAHLDTVPLCAGASPRVRGRKVVPASRTTGLGGDDRAGCAVLVATATELLRRAAPHPPLTFLWTVQEEVGLHGARDVSLAALGRPVLGFNWDGGAAGRLTLGATGGYRMEIAVEGRASHAGVRPEQGVSAVAVASLAVADLVREGWHGKIERDDGSGTCNVGVIRGGAATNVVADRVDLMAEARSHDARFRQTIVSRIEEAFRRAAAEVRNVDGEAGRTRVAGRLDYESFRLPADSPGVELARAAAEAEGAPIELAIANGGLDANWLNAHGIPTVTLGCGQNAIHTIDEWLDLDEFETACRIAWRLATATEHAALNGRATATR